MCDVTIDDVVAALQDFVYYLAHRHASEATIMLDFDEIVGELSLELVKGFNYYKDKNITEEQMLAVIRRILDNRIGELMYKHFKTHRQSGLNYVPVEQLAELDGSQESHGESTVQYKPTQAVIQAHIALSPSPESLLESQERVERLYAALSPEANRVLHAILDGNDLLALNLQLSIDRSSAVFKNAVVKLQPWHVADSIGVDDKVVAEAFIEIRNKYAEVCS